MSAPPATPTPRPRGAAGAVAPRMKICLRCVFAFCKDPTSDWDECNAAFGSLKTKCSRCSRVRHACEPLADRNVVKLFNQAFDTQRALEAPAFTRLDDDEQAAAITAAAAARKALGKGVGAFHGNKNKMVGDKPTPRKLFAGAAGAGSGAADFASAESLQSIDRSLRAMVEMGRALMQANGLSHETVDAVMAGEERDEEMADAGGEEEDDDEEEDDEEGEGSEGEGSDAESGGS